ncbi:MAG: hypothetical protein JXB05_29210 [Myxococcaceae bacterium]|nr:hypothetical protein [Myxococcaceae bacterium]
MSDLVKVETTALTRRGTISAELLREEREQRKLLGQYVQECMVESQDFGKIPGTDKPTLLKPGAEKLIDIFNCTPEFTLVSEFSREDFVAGFFKYTFRCRILSRGTGAVLAEGYGSANSREQRYRWRTAHRRCPGCQQESIIQGKAEYGGGWVCFKKKGGCGAKFAAEDTRITGQPIGRVENEDIADLDNTILKMAKKRALVDGAIALARCSDMFTQDVEDLDDGGPPAPPPATPATVTHFSKKETPASGPPRDTPPTTPAPVAPSPAGEPLVVFGPLKGKLVKALTDAELEEVLNTGTAMLSKDPNAGWANTMRKQLEALDAEVDRRFGKAVDKALAPEPPPAGGDDVPF